MARPHFLHPWYARWATEVAIRIPAFSLAARHRQQILDEIHPNPDADLTAKLITALEGNISYYKARDEFERNLAPRKDVRRMLTRVTKRIDVLERVLGALDWHTRFTLAPFLEGKTEPSLGLRLLSARKPPEMQHLDERLCALGDELRELADAAARCREVAVPRVGGPRLLTAREFFAVDIADSLQEFVPESVPIVTTEGQPYENIVRVCIEAADGQFKGDAHRLILAAIKTYNSSYRPHGLKSVPGVKTTPT